MKAWMVYMKFKSGEIEGVVFSRYRDALDMQILFESPLLIAKLSFPILYSYHIWSLQEP